MSDYFEDYLRIYEISNSINEQNIDTIPLKDLQMITILLKDIIQRQSIEIKELRKEIKTTKSLNSDINPLSITSFIAIDFETATYKRMACQLGIVKVENLQIVEEMIYLIQPPNNYYDSGCLSVHGINPSITKNSPTFRDLWPEIKHYFNDTPVVAHNAAFDIDVLKTNCTYYNLSLPELTTFCTCQIHNNLTLPDTCALYNIELRNHHDALEDARACAKIFIHHLKIINSLKSSKVKENSQARKEKNSAYFKPASRTISSEALKQDLRSVSNPDNYFYNKKVVITGVFKTFPIREDLALKLKEMGADVCTSISKKTNIVIHGEGSGPAKLNKVAVLQAEGYDIVLIDEVELSKLLI